MLDFDPGPHVYRWRGTVVPSVTQLLDRMHSFAGVPEEVLASARERGTFVHEMCEALDLGYLDEEAVAGIEEGRFVGYLNAWRAFCTENKPDWHGIERRSYSERHRYAGTWDRHGSLGKFGAHSRWVVDIKSSLQSHWVWGLQTAAYRNLIAEIDSGWALARRATVQLNPDGRYRFITWDDPEDWPDFQALLRLNRRSPQ